MTFGRLEDRFRDSPKINRLAKLLGVRQAEAAGLWANLYTWALVHAIDGDVTNLTDWDLERAAMWEGDPGAFAAAIKSDQVRIHEMRNGRSHLHDWWDFAEGIKKAKAQKKRRDRKLRDSSRSPRVGGVSPTGRHMSAAEEQSRSDQSRAERSRAEQAATPALFPAGSADADPPAVLLLFPATGGVSHWALTEDVVRSLQEGYPGVDVLAEARRALLWVEAHPSRRKTSRGYRAFLTSWLSRAVDNGRVARLEAAGGPRLTDKQRYRLEEAQGALEILRAQDAAMGRAP